MIKLKRDSRDLAYSKHYGQTTIFPNEYNADKATPDTLQPAGDVKCTAITTCDIASDQVGVQYDYTELFSRVPHDENGADPRDALKQAIKVGLKRMGDGQIDTHWKSFYRADTGGMDYFDNIRSAIFFAQSPIMFATPWYSNWGGVVTLPMGENVTNYHAYSVEGWKLIDNVPYLIIEPWLGRKMYMSREVCNKVLSAWGAQAWVLATDEIDGKRTKNILEKIVDACINAIILLKQAIALENKEQPMEPIKTHVEVTPSTKLYDVAKSLLKKHLTLNNAVPKDVGCAQALSYVLKEAGYDIPKGGISSTSEMYKWLKENFDEVEAGKMGNVIINVSFTGKPGRRGHVGICGIWQIMSNDSDTGLWSAHWELPNWLNFYEKQGGMKTHYFKAR